GIRDRNVTGVQTCALPISRLLTPLQNPLKNSPAQLNKVPSNAVLQKNKQPLKRALQASRTWLRKKLLSRRRKRPPKNQPRKPHRKRHKKPPKKQRLKKPVKQLLSKHQLYSKHRQNPQSKKSINTNLARQKKSPQLPSTPKNLSLQYVRRWKVQLTRPPRFLSWTLMFCCTTLIVYLCSKSTMFLFP